MCGSTKLVLVSTGSVPVNIEIVLDIVELVQVNTELILN